MGFLAAMSASRQRAGGGGLEQRPHQFRPQQPRRAQLGDLEGREARHRIEMFQPFEVRGGIEGLHFDTLRDPPRRGGRRMAPGLLFAVQGCVLPRFLPRIGEQTALAQPGTESGWSACGKRHRLSRQGRWREGEIPMNRRLNISLPERTVDLIDRVAGKRHRSALIDRAVVRYIQGESRADLEERIADGARARAERDLRLAEG